MKQRFFIVPLLMVIAAAMLFYPSLTAKAEVWHEWTSQTNVAANKTWTITLTKAVDIATVKAPNIYVVDSRNEMVDVSFAVQDEGKQIVIEPPVANYKMGETYTLYITERVLTKRQQPLLKPTKMAFTVAKLVEQVAGYDIRTDSEQQVILQDDVKQLTNEQSEALQLIRPNAIQVAASAHTYEVGDIVLLPATNDYPFGLAREITSIEKNAKGYLYNVVTPEASDIVSKVDVSQVIPITAENFVAAPGVRLQSPVASLQNHALSNGVASVFNGGDLELSLLQLKMGQEFFATGSIVLKNPRFIIDLNDESLNLLEDATVVFDSGIDFQAAVGLRAGSEVGSINPTNRNPFEAKFMLGQVYVPIPQFPLLGGKFGLYVIVGVDGELRLEVKRALDFEVGGRWTDGDFTKIKKVTLPPEQNESPVPNYSAVMQATAKLGVGVEAAVALTSEINLASISAEAGAKSMQSVFNYKDTLCYKGTTSLFVEASMQTEAIKRYEWKILGIEKMIQTAEQCPYVMQFKVTPEQVELAPGDELPLQVTKVPLYGKDVRTVDDVTFTSSDPNRVKVYHSGLIRVLPDAKSGNVTITAVYHKGTNLRTATVNIKVTGEESSDEQQPPAGETPNEETPEEMPVVTDNIVDIPDSYLEENIRSTLKIPEGPLRESDLKRLTYLYLYSVDDALDLTGLQYALNLESLDISEATSISNLEALSALPALKRIDINESNVTDLTPIQTITSLEYLNVSENKLTSIAPVASLTNLKQLYIDYNEVVDLSPIASLSELTILGAGYNNIKSVAPLKNVRKLQLIHLWYNNITSIEALGNLPDLHDVVLESNAIKDISPLANATKIQGININQNAVKDISSLQALTTLITLNADDNNITNISPLKGLTKLRTLSLTNNSIADITPIANLTNLNTLSLEGNKVKSLDAMKNLTKLQYVFLANNQISTIKPIAHIETIERLDLENNAVKDITLLHQIKALKYLNVRGNPVPDVHLHVFDNIPGLFLERSR